MEVFLQPLEKCCNALSSNISALTFVRPIDLVALLNINDSFYNTTIIKQNNMAYQHKVIFCFRDGFKYMGSGWITIYLLLVSYPYFEIGENSNPYPVKTGKTCQIKFDSDG